MSPSDSPEPSPLAASEPAGAPSPAGDGGSVEFPRRKSRHRQEEREAETSHEQQIMALSSLLASLLEKQGGTVKDPPKTSKVYRFTPKTPLGERTEGPAVGEASAELTEAANSSAAATRSPARNWRTVTSTPVASSTSDGAYAYWGVAILVAVVAFFVGRGTGTTFRRPVPTSPTAATAPAIAWSEENVKRLDRALEADQAGDLETAGQLTRALRAEAGSLPGLEAYIASLGVRRDRVNDAQADLAKLLINPPAGADLAGLQNAFGFALARTRKFAQASAAYKTASLAAPFAAENFRLLGESQRREGRFREALSSFQEALARYPVGASEFADIREQVAYKLRLVQIEGGLDAELGASLKERLASDANGYWCLTGAAYCLQRGDGPGAAAALRQAKALLTPRRLESLLSDYFFRAYAARPELTAYMPAKPDQLGRELIPRQVPFIDP